MPQYLYPPVKVKETPFVSFPSTIAAATSWFSPIVVAPSIKSIVVGLTLDQPGTLAITRYADAAGLSVVGAMLLQDLTANLPAWAGTDDGIPFASFSIEITNSGGVTANLSRASALGNS